MNSVDLFTGIGGFARALRDICKPVLYCDSDRAVRASLEGIIERGHLPRAPIVHDVRDLAAIRAVVGKKRVQVLTAGIPCTGWSKRGYMLGLADARSGMFFAAHAVIAALKPRLVLFENVSEITSGNGGADIRKICESMSDIGYTVRWTVVAASDVGAPHVRARWFCLCVRVGSRHPDLPARKATRPWSRVPTHITEPRQDISHQLFLLGNALVPQAALAALYRLYSGFAPGVAFKKECIVRPSNWRVPGEAGVPKHGCLQDGEIVPCVAPPMTLPRETIVVSPRHFHTKQVYVENTSRPVRSPPIKAAFTMTAWPTPRTGGITHSHNLSKRTRFDLSTVAMFASSVNGKRLPPTDDSHRMSLAFAEWLMGFPVGYLQPAVRALPLVRA